MGTSETRKIEQVWRGRRKRGSKKGILILLQLFTQTLPNFIVGNPLTRFLSPDSSLEEIRKFITLREEGKWYPLLRKFMKWSSGVRGPKFEGEEDVAAVVNWDNALRDHFTLMGWTTPVACAVAATSTFMKKAKAWWRAHTVRYPDLYITYSSVSGMG